MRKLDRRNFLRAFGVGVAAPLPVREALGREGSDGMLRVFPTLAEAKSGAVPDAIQRIRVEGYAVPGKGGAHYRRAATEPGHGGKFVDSTGVWWELDETEPTVEMFGAKGDLTFDLVDAGTLPAPNAGVQGYIRTGGTNDRAAFEAADGYARAAGSGAYYADGNYYINGQLNCEAVLKSRMAFRNFIWLHYGIMECGILIRKARGGVDGMNLIGQYDHTGPKPVNRGELGNIIETGFFYTNTAQTLIHDVHTDVRVCRAADAVGRGAVAEQNSRPSLMAGTYGLVEDSHFKYGTHGKSNVTSLMLYLEHWGCHYDPATLAYDAAETDKTPARIIETYHPARNRFTPTTRIDGRDEANRIQRGWELASTAGSIVDPSDMIGVKEPYRVGAGDVVDFFAGKRHKGFVGKGIRIGFVRALDCVPDGRQPYAIYIKGRGNSKFEKYPGTGLDLARQMAFDVICQGHYITGTGNPDYKGIFLSAVLGRVDLGPCEIYGFPRAIEREHGSANVIYDLTGSDGTILHEFAQGGAIRGSSTSKGDDLNTAGAKAENAKVEAGYNADNHAVSLFGRTLTTTTVAPVSAGDTIIPIVAFDGRHADIYIDQEITIGGETVYARALIDGGVPYLATTPVQADVPAGARVTVDQRALLDEFVGSFESSEHGLAMIEADILRANLSKIRWTGRYAAHLTESTLHGHGALPRAVGQLPSDSNYTLFVDKGSHVTWTAMDARTNTRIAAHFLLQNDAAEQAGLSVSGGRVEDVSTLLHAADALEQVRLSGVHDLRGAPVRVPGASGSNENGDWVCHEDGTQECWIRNWTLRANPDLWTFPRPFIATASTVVTGMSSTPKSPRIVTGFATSSTQATVNLFTHAGAQSMTTPVSLHAIGRWY